MKVLITGATGNIGSHLAYEFLKRPDVTVALLVRGQSLQHARERAAHALSFWGTYDSSRVQVFQSDMSKKNWGLSPEDLAALNDIQLVVHSASTLRLALSLEKARESILRPTQELFTLAQGFEQFRRFFYISTIEFSVGYPGTLPENFIRPEEVTPFNTYEKAKIETEIFLKSQINNGATISIFRVGLLIGETSTGKIPKFQSFYLTLEKMLLAPDLPIVPHGSNLDIIPIDFVSKALVNEAFSQHPRAVYHLSPTSNEKLSFDHFVNLVVELWPEKVKRPIYIPPLPVKWLILTLNTLTLGRIKKLANQAVFAKFLGTEAKIENTLTKEQLEKSGLTWPTPTDYFNKIIAYYFNERSRNNLPF